MSSSSEESVSVRRRRRNSSRDSFLAKLRSPEEDGCVLDTSERNLHEDGPGLHFADIDREEMIPSKRVASVSLIVRSDDRHILVGIMRFRCGNDGIIS